MTAETLRGQYPGLDDLAALVLLALCAGPSGGRALSKKLGRAQSDVFRALSLLEEAGLIAAQPPVADDPLRRTVALTPAGLQLAAQTKTPPV